MRWDIQVERLQYGSALGELWLRWRFRRRGKMKKFCDACHLGAAKMVFAAEETLAGGDTPNVVLKVKLSRESRTLLHNTVTMYSDEQGAAVSWVQTDVYILGRRRRRGKEGMHSALCVTVMCTKWNDTWTP